MSEYVLTFLLPEQVRARWGRIVELLKPVEDHCHGELLVEDLLPLVDEKRIFLLALWKDEVMACVGAFEVMTYPRKKVLNCIMVGGNGATRVLREFRENLQMYARAVGATALRGYVRPSVARLLKQAAPGTREIYTVVETPL